MDRALGKEGQGGRGQAGSGGVDRKEGGREGRIKHRVVSSGKDENTPHAWKNKIRKRKLRKRQ